MTPCKSRDATESTNTRTGQTTAEDVYEEHGDIVDELAGRDDEIGAIMRALKRTGGDDSDDA